jgi:hypothetical protein
MSHDERVDYLIPVAIAIGFVVLIVGGIAVMPAARRFDARQAAARVAAGKRPMSK